MFKPARLMALVVVSILVTAGLYLAYGDTGTDSPVQIVTLAALVLLVTTLLYAAIYGLARSARQS